MVERSFINAFLEARCIHIKDSNNYDMWVKVKDKAIPVTGHGGP
jgi:hypothetical protein